MEKDRRNASYSRAADDCLSSVLSMYIFAISTYTKIEYIHVNIYTYNSQKVSTLVIHQFPAKKGISLEQTKPHNPSI